MMADSLRVLYVDDEPDLLDIGTIFLEGSKNFKVTTAPGASEAILLLVRAKFDVIISDYQMPGMDGIEFLIEVRKRFGSIPFILFTGKGREEVVIQAINQGADFYLQKGGEPAAQFAELSHKVMQAVSRKRVEEALRNSEEKYRHLIEHSNQAIAVIQDGMLKLVNHRSVEFTGYTEQELLSMQFPALIDPDDREMVVERYRKRMKGEDLPPDCTFRVRRRDGGMRWIELKVAPIDWEGCPATLNFFTDITERKEAETALRESEEKYRSLVGHVHDGIYIYQGDHFVYTNAMVTTMTGYSQEELLTTPFISLVHADDQAFIRDIAERRMRMEPVSGTYECRIIRKDGVVRTLEIAVATIPYKNGIAALGAARDVTDRKQAEQLLKESEEQYRVIADFTYDWEYWIAPDRKLIYVSPSCERITGYGPGEFILDPALLVTITHPDDQKIIINHLSELPKLPDHTVAHRTLEFRIISKDGTVRWIGHKCQSVYDRNGEFRGIRGSNRDITERKLVEEALREKEKKYRYLVENLNDVVFSVDQNGFITYVSPAGERQYGYSSSDLLGKPFTDVVFSDDVPHIQKRFREINQGIIEPFDWRLIHRDGTVTWVRTSTRPVPDHQGNKRFLGIISDISREKRAEDALREVNRKLSLLSGITRHDISNQLTVMQGYLKIMEKKHQDPALGEYFQKMNASAERISAMIRFTEEYESIGVHVPAWQDARTFVDTASGQAPLGNVVVKNDLPEDLEVFADPLIVKVCYNLMDNAVRYGGKITTIHFSVDDTGGKQIIVCEDDGIGIPVGEKEKIFDRGHGKHTGLGLALSREILSITGITIRETGEPGNGARFEMTVPDDIWCIVGKGELNG